MSTIKKWQTVGEDSAEDHFIFTIKHVSRTSPRTGLTSKFFTMQSGDWCNILPITPDGNVVFIHQYRHGSDSVTMEIPAGMVDPHETDPLEAAKRELLEETGYSAEKVVKIGVVEPNPAFMDNHCHLYLALGALRIKEQQLGSNEDIAVEEVALEKIDELIDSGRVSHSLVIANLYFFERYIKKHNLVLGD